MHLLGIPLWTNFIVFSEHTYLFHSQQWGRPAGGRMDIIIKWKIPCPKHWVFQSALEGISAGGLPECLIFQTLASSRSPEPRINQPMPRGWGALVCLQFIDECSRLHLWRVEMNLPKVTQLSLFIYSLTCSKKDFEQLSHTVRKFLVVFLLSQEKQAHTFFFLSLNDA